MVRGGTEYRGRGGGGQLKREGGDITEEAEHRGKEDGRGHCPQCGALAEQLQGEQEGYAMGHRGPLNTEGRKTSQDTAFTMVLCRNSRGSEVMSQRTGLRWEKCKFRSHTSECSDESPL